MSESQLPAGIRAALLGIAVAVLGLGIALIATIQILSAERGAHERTQATLSSLRDSLRTAAEGAPGRALTRVEGIPGGSRPSGGEPGRDAFPDSGRSLTPAGRTP